jgi:hypothetical protein
VNTEDNHPSGTWMPDDRPEPEDCSLTPGCINCAGHLPPCTGKDGKRVYRAGEHPLERLHLKPRTTVKRFAADLKTRIERAAVGFDQPGQDEYVSGVRYALGIVDAALSDYDVRDPGDM